MERVYIIMFILLLNALYYGHLAIQWNNTSDDGVTGRSFVGVFITIVSTIIIFNLDYILNHQGS